MNEGTKVPHCYFLAACAGSSVDQHSNNATLFSLIEQINVPPGAPPPPRGLVPVEMHAYFELGAGELERTFELRFVMLASTGLETSSDAFAHRSVTPRFRTRTLGLPFPPVVGAYELCVDLRWQGELGWHRAAVRWPIGIVELIQKPRITH